jgi:hypothetical protein
MADRMDSQLVVGSTVVPTHKVDAVRAIGCKEEWRRYANYSYKG